MQCVLPGYNHWACRPGWIQFLNLRVVLGNFFACEFGLISEIALYNSVERNRKRQSQSFKFLPAFFLKPYETSAVVSLLSGRSWPFQGKLAKIQRSNKTHRISSYFRFCSEQFVMSLFYTGQGWFGSERICQVVLCSVLGSDARIGREHQEFSHICHARRHWKPGTAGEQLQHF